MFRFQNGKINGRTELKALGQITAAHRDQQSAWNLGVAAKLRFTPLALSATENEESPSNANRPGSHPLTPARLSKHKEEIHTQLHRPTEVARSLFFSSAQRQAI